MWEGPSLKNRAKTSVWTLGEAVSPGKCILEISVWRGKEGYWVLMGVPERWLGKIWIRLSFFQAKQVWKKACSCARVLGSEQLISSVLGKCVSLYCKTSLSNESSWLHFSNDLSLHWRQVLLNCPNKHRNKVTPIFRILGVLWLWIQTDSACYAQTSFYVNWCFNW